MDSAQLLIVNIEVFCLLGLLIPCLAVAIYLLLRRQRRTGLRILTSACLIAIAIWSLGAINRRVIVAQDINPECIGHSDPINQDCSQDLSLTLPYAEVEALRQADIFWDTLECVVIPSILGVSLILFMLWRRAQYLSAP